MANIERLKKYGARPSADIQRRVTRVLMLLGRRRGALELGVSRDCAAGVALGSQVIPATLALIEQRLPRIEAELEGEP